MNTYTFDELAMYNAFKGAIQEAFEQPNGQDTSYWFNLFGKRKPEFYNSYDVEKPKFPCFIITFTESPVETTITSCEIEQYTRVDFDIEAFNQAVGNLDKTTLGIMINNQLKKYLQQKYGVLLTSNRALPNIDNTIYRRLVSGVMYFDNKNQIIYKGE